MIMSQYYTMCACLLIFDNVIQMSIDLKTWKTPNHHYSKTNCSISFKLTVFNTDTHRCLHVNFLSYWISFKVTKNYSCLTIWGHSHGLWSYRNTIHLEFFKNINFKLSNDWLLGIAHMVLFTLQYCYSG